jgi:ubiquinone/menaquinone biosynthesis C-methylase UbiE
MHNPDQILDSYIRPGMTVLEPGPGMGFFTLEMARRVGPKGRVVAVDVQPKMLESLRRRAEKRNLSGRVETRLAGSRSMELPDSLRVDFVLAFAVVHEMEGGDSFFRESAAVMKPGAKMLLAEPAGHVTEAEFANELENAAATGLRLTGSPEIRKSQTALFEK